MSELQRDIDARRTFAIISHPDAGKTTMTEKLLLLGLLLSAWRSRDRRGLIVIALSLRGLLLPSPHTDSEVSRPVVLDLSAQLELGEGCEVLPAVIHDDSLRLSGRCPDR